jgi:hypothetical protein
MKLSVTKIITLSLPLFVFPFLLTSPVLANCTSRQPVAGAMGVFPATCGDAQHWCGSTQECIDNNYTVTSTPPPPGGGSVTNTNNASTEISCNNNPNSINTALGCISVDNGGQDFISKIITLSIGLGGAIALLLMLYGFYILTTSAGMPDKVKAGKEIITSAVAGLLFIILSAVVLNLLGVQVLGLPGF